MSDKLDEDSLSFLKISLYTIYFTYLIVIVNDCKGIPIPAYVGFYLICISSAIAITKQYRRRGEIIKIINDTILFLAAAFASMKMLYIISPIEDISVSSLEKNFIPFALRFILIVCSFTKAFMSATDIKGKPSKPDQED
ncbi:MULTISPECIES: hypothetical protein [Enterobacteriaceae]|nr:MULTISPECIES: hypothetical protein [Enterobacteriaceae]ECF2871870.1 hypothetical protein [Salmonella enterica subsp. enterica serovar Hadar]EJA3105736.1 hypothetical protein [Cronobacter sakazakii]HBM9905359.1 hypothetical protein [Enterobacter chengduensis]HBS0595516.1 hypothetical protein [Klebsiella quasipneumoniae subsp. quasipneumoniae]HCB0261697.1 hypothetical protein [Klebsiella quasipneumoniae subsp. similipneumoniae]HCJ7335064.1 hypothetical protein [Enterobacter hormaechei subsp.